MSNVNEMGEFLCFFILTSQVEKRLNQGHLKRVSVYSVLLRLTQSNLFHWVYKELSISHSLELQLLLCAIQKTLKERGIFPSKSSVSFAGLSRSSFGSVPSVLACWSILGYVSSSTLTLCPYHLNCADSITSLREIIPDPVFFIPDPVVFSFSHNFP